MTVATIDHIVIDDLGCVRIKNSRIKVINLVMETRTNDWAVDDLLLQYPHLPPAAIYAAFAYYYDHKGELDRQIQESIEIAHRMRQQSQDDPLMKKLRAIKESSK